MSQENVPTSALPYGDPKPASDWIAEERNRAMDALPSADIAFQVGINALAIATLLAARPDLELRLWSGELTIWRHDPRSEGPGEGRLAMSGIRGIEPGPDAWRSTMQDLGVL